MKKGTIGQKIYLILVILFLYLPILVLMVLSFNEGKSMQSWQGFSLKWYREMFQNTEILNALGNTLTIAFLSALIATVIGVLASIGLNKMSEKKRSVYLGLNNIPLLNADIVTGIAIMISFVLLGVSLNYGTVLFAHITFEIPYVILSVMPRFKKLDGNIYEAALDLGAGPVYAFFKVVLPDLMPGIVSGFLLTFTMSVDDFVITHFTRGNGINTLSTIIYSQVKVGIRPTLYALSTILFVLVLVVLIIANISANNSKDRKENNKTIDKLLNELPNDKRAKFEKDVEKHDRARKRHRRFKTVVSSVLIIALAILSIRFIKSDSNVGKNGQLYIYCFGDYFDPTIISEFEQETGYDVIIDYFDTNEEMYPVIKNNTADYDLICTSDYMIEKMAKEGLLEEINWDNIPNAVNLTDFGKKLTENFDAGMKYSCPHTFGVYGIVYNKNIVNLGEDTSWNVLFNEKYAGTIVMPNSVREAFMVAAEVLGYSINTTEEAELQEIEKLLQEQKTLVYSYANDYARDLAVSGSIGLAVINSGEVLYSVANNSDLGFIVPTEGSEIWMDSWVIPKSVNNKVGAETFINYILQDDVAIKNFEYLTYPIPNKALLSEDYYIEDEDLRRAVEIFSGSTNLKDCHIINPPESLLNKCESLISLSQEGDALYSKYWKMVKS